MARTNSKAKKTSKTSKNRLPQHLTQLPELKLTPTANLGNVKLWLTSAPCSSVEEHRWPQLALLNSTYSSNLDSSKYYNSLTNYAQQPNGSHWGVARVENDVNRRPFWRRQSPFEYASSSSSYCGTRGGAIWAYLSYALSSALMVWCFNARDKRKWIRHECTAIDPFDAKGRRMQFTGIISGSDDKIYALSLQGSVAVLEEVDSCLMITAISSTRGVPSVSSKYFKEYFFELNGDILLVFLIYERSLKIVDEVEVFRLCFDKLKWIKVERLGGKALFVDKCGIGAHSEEVGCKKNCVYFTQGSDNGWWVYDMKTTCISPSTYVDKLSK